MDRYACVSQVARILGILRNILTQHNKIDALISTRICRSSQITSHVIFLCKNMRRIMHDTTQCVCATPFSSF
jgi:hypothetical protein